MFALLVLSNILSAGLLTGAMMEVAVADIPMFLELLPETFIVVHRGIDRHKHPYMPAYTIIAIITALGELWFYRSFWEILCIIVGVICILSVGLISELINVPLNRKMHAWASDSAGEEVLLSMRGKWIRAHYLRTAAGILGFFVLLLPLIVVWKP
jgi:hypothetical protein